MAAFIAGLSSKRRAWIAIAAAAAVVALLSLAGATRTSANNEEEPDGDQSKIRIGFAIAPVELDLTGKNPALVGLGATSSMVRAVVPSATPGRSSRRAETHSSGNRNKSTSTAI